VINSSQIQQPWTETCLSSEYALDILKATMEREVNFMPKWNYMTKQPDITFTMRSILIDWLIEVGEEYKLGTETLFLAVNYIDRFLSFMSVQRAKLQLVGTACMFIAAKYEEIYPPDVTEFCYITDDTYSKRQVLRMEHLVLQQLQFGCAPPTAYFFVNHLAGMAGCGPRATALAQYLTELTMIDGEGFMHFMPSIIASAAVALSRHTMGMAAWEDSMVAKTGYNVDDFKECLIRLHETFERAPQMAQQAVREKYKNASYHSVSEVKPTPIF
jgi:cyclin A